jgi:hypothetical protein
MARAADGKGRGRYDRDMSVGYEKKSVLTLLLAMPRVPMV